MQISEFSNNEVLMQLFVQGPTWDGDLVSKDDRNKLLEAGYSGKVNGWNFLTTAGINVAVVNGLAAKDWQDQRWYRKAANLPARSEAASPTAVGMPVDEQLQMLKRTSEEIRSLRRRIDELTPKANAYDNLSALIGMFPQRSIGMGEDLAWLIDRRASEIQSSLAKPEAIE